MSLRRGLRARVAARRTARLAAVDGGRRKPGKVNRAIDTARPHGSSAKARWEKVDEHAFLLRSTAEPRAIVRFVGGALVGAAPQLTYNRFLEQLAARGLWVLAASYATDLDYIAAADLVETRFERAHATLGFGALPTWGLGHSLGALAQVLISSRHPVGQRRGQILVSYTRRGEEALPAARVALKSNPLLGPLLRAVDVGAATDLLKRSSAMLDGALRTTGAGGTGALPALQDVVPLAEQMLPLLREVGLEQEEFRPSGARLLSMVREGYRERCTLLVRLSEDGLDETPGLAAMLADLPADRHSDLTLRVLPGQHLLPLLPDLQVAAAPPFAFLPVSVSSGFESKDRWAGMAEQQLRVVDVVDNFIAANM